MNNRTKNILTCACLVGFGLLILASGQTTAAAFFLGFGVCATLETIGNAIRAKRPKLDNDQNAVSPVIGVILMVAITVVLAAIVFVLISHLGDVEQIPRLSISSDGAGNFTVLKADRGIPWSDLLFGPGASCSPTPEAMDHAEVLAGDVVHCTADRLTIVHMPTNAVLYSH